MGESSLGEELRDIAVGEGVELGFRTSFPDNTLRSLARAATAEEAEASLETVSALIRERLGPLIYSEADESMEEGVVWRRRE